MQRLFYILFLNLLLLNLYAGPQMFQESIRNYIESKPENSRYTLDNELLYSSQVMPRFYINRLFEPAWFTDDRINANGASMLEAIRKIYLDGLEPADYHLKKIEFYYDQLWYAKSTEMIDMVKLEILFTDAFLLMASHLYFGKVDPGEIKADWKIQRKEPDLRIDLILQQAIYWGDINSALEKLRPTIKHYHQLKADFIIFNPMVYEEWEEIPFEKVLKVGEQHETVSAIRARVKRLGYHIESLDSLTFDDQLLSQIKHYQQRHGLNADGIIGRRTIESLNIKPQERLDAIRVNLERIRWLPVEFPKRFILVNIADAWMDVIDGKDTLLSMRAIVGRNYRKTPVFSGRMSYLVFSPSWTVPPGILSKDILPELKKGPEYLINKNMQILRADGTVVDYHSIDWPNISSRNFPYMVRQNPGPDNALGKVKFMFPNQYNVYIHDTPARGQFAQESRALSSGCIRAEKPFELAQLLLASNPAWSAERINKAMNGSREQTVILPDPIPVVMVYFTAWSNEKNGTNFRLDIYKRDDDVLAALKQKPLEYIIR
jgi:L,D-transpeptidase YcbB